MKSTTLKARTYKKMLIRNQQGERVYELIKKLKFGGFETNRKGSSYWTLRLESGKFEQQDYRASYGNGPLYEPYTVIGLGLTFKRARQLMKLCPLARWFVRRGKLCAATESFFAEFDLTVIPKLKPNPKRELRHRGQIELAKRYGIRGQPSISYARAWLSKYDDELAKRWRAIENQTEYYRNRYNAYPGVVSYYYAPTDDKGIGMAYRYNADGVVRREGVKAVRGERKLYSLFSNRPKGV